MPYDNWTYNTAVNGVLLSSSVIMQNAANSNGNGVVLPTTGYGIAVLSIAFSTSPAWSGIVNFEAQGPDNNWYPINGRMRGGSSTPSTTITSGTGLYSLNVRGIQAIRARVSGYSAGSVTITGQTQALPSSDADEIANVSLLGSNPTDGLSMATNFEQVFNGNNYDRVRGNTQGTLLASAARTSNTNSPNQTNYNARGVHITLNVTAASGTGGLQVIVFGVDINDHYYQLNPTPTAITTTGPYGYELYPGTSGTAGSSASSLQQSTSRAIPRTWFVRVVHGDASSYTYELNASPIL